MYATSAASGFLGPLSLSGQVAVEQPRRLLLFQLFRARNHKGIEMRSFPSRSEAVEAAGLSE